MSMTLEEAIECLKTIQRWTPEWDYREDGLSYWDAIDMALSALHPVSREQVEKMKKEPVEGGYDELYAPTYKCPECGFENIGSGNFCRNCGCLHTDKAVEMVMERLEALNDGKGD